MRASPAKSERNEEIRRRAAAGMAPTELARTFNLSKTRVQAILEPRSELIAKARAYDALVAAGVAPPLGVNGKGAADGKP